MKIHFSTQLKYALSQVAILGMLFTASFGAQASSTLNLANYQLSATYALPRLTAREASAITYNWDTHTLFVIGDEGEALVEVSKTGQQLSVMSLSGFEDTEGLTYMGNGRFVITEERLRNAYQIDYNAGGTADRSVSPFVDLGSPVGNIGVEGITFDPRDGSFITVKEKTPQEINYHFIDFANGTLTTASIFNPSLLGLIDISDVQVLSTGPFTPGSSTANNLLILSQESSRLLEVDRNGSVLSAFDLSGFSSSAEGVTIDTDGIIYIVDENGTRPRLFVLTAVPIPPAFFLFGTGLMALIGMGRRKTR
ncbi:MAG: SdiA-regulated domain-containing protein [Methylicorpusculum sp.]|uniref:SdiA-regulated domain-containing protein n=1 Tax=Methylicorpusculum sp. TaxID=2713644 RepID=UPI0027193A8A|nr:SdiA-regulated domain-containing protein [Methylicorpusculum sp.]MDO8938291.1 SdiA-regulated domain-containing protein [Methylicorpusculum sp.]MDP2204638.1 SdiA-regulated domain-containing protein [Methylicorpusculum sp.]